jgi:hypothetical protein
MNSTKEEESMRTKVLLVAVGLIGFGLSVSAATIPVTTTNPAVAADGQCSLIEAIDNANADAATHADCPAGSGADTIELANSTTYTLDQVYVTSYGPNGLPIIHSNVTIDGRNSTIRRAPAAPAFRILVVNSSGTLALNDLTLEGGDSGPTYCGGALLNAFGSAALTRTTVTGSTATGGGGICNSSGPMTLDDSVIELNTASGVGGGGILSLAEVADASLILEATLIQNNTAAGTGGGVYIQSEIDPWVSTMQVVESTVNGNHAGSAGGGMAIWRTTAEITRSTFNDNTVETTEDWGGSGGGLLISDSGVFMSNSTVSGNEAGGAATTMIFSGRGGGVSVVGGGWGVTPVVDTVLILEDSTICDNTAQTYGGGISVYRYAGTMAVEVELRNTIVAENLEADGAILGNCIEESPAIVSSLDFNLADDLTCNLVGTDDLVVADVMLGVLADNGGPTLTHQPEAGSPAIDSGDDAMCPLIDQHGNIRPWDGDDDGQVHCDRGAVELGAPFFADGFETGDTTGWSNTTP